MPGVNPCILVMHFALKEPLPYYCIIKDGTLDMLIKTSHEKCQKILITIIFESI
jgi:hypothetical protein